MKVVGKKLPEHLSHRKYTCLCCRAVLVLELPELPYLYIGSSIHECPECHLALSYNQYDYTPCDEDGNV